VRRILLAILGTVFVLCLTSTPVAADGQPTPQSSSNEQQESSDSESSSEDCKDDSAEEEVDEVLLVFAAFCFGFAAVMLIIGLTL